MGLTHSPAQLLLHTSHPHLNATNSTTNTPNSNCGPLIYNFKILWPLLCLLSMLCSMLCNLSKSSPFLRMWMAINSFNAEGSNQVHIELDSYFLYPYCLKISVFHKVLKNRRGRGDYELIQWYMRACISLMKVVKWVMKGWVLALNSFWSEAVCKM